MNTFDPERFGAVVIGNGFTKTWTLNEKTRRIFPSVVAAEQSGISFDGFKSAKDLVIEYDGQRFAVGDSARKLGRIQTVQMDRSRVNSPFYKQLFAAALATMFPSSGNVDVVITLPLSWYESREDVKKRLVGEWLIKTGSKTLELNVTRVRAVPEGFGVLAMHMLDTNGSIHNADLARMSVGVCEIGTGTTDLSFFENLELIRAKSTGMNLGLVFVWQSIQADILKDTGRELALHAVDKAIREGVFNDFGKPINMDKYTKRYMPQLAASIDGGIGTNWGERGREANYIFIAGGGGPQTFPYMQSYPHAAKVDNAVTADADGAFRYGLFKGKAGK